MTQKCLRSKIRQDWILVKKIDKVIKVTDDEDYVIGMKQVRNNKDVKMIKKIWNKYDIN